VVSKGRAKVFAMKGGGDGRSRLREIVKTRICIPNRVNRILLEGLANVQQAAREEVRHPGAKVSFGDGQRLRLLMERGIGFKVGTVVGRAGGERHLISWSGEALEQRGGGSVSIDLETVLWIPESARGPTIKAPERVVPD
jgi:hypothetical protein